MSDIKPPPYPAKPPDPKPVAEGDEATIARINDLSKAARTSWFGLLAYLAFVGVTLLGVEDADFFIPSRQTQLPLINVAIHTASFFLFAPILGAALYVYLHLHLTKLWEAIGPARSRIGGDTLSPQLYPWLVNDLALTYPGQNPAPRKPLTWLSNLVTRLLVWIAGPFVLIGFWWRSHPAHDEWLTLGIAACLALALYTGLASWWGFRGYLRGNAGHRQWARWFRWMPGLAALFGIIILSWLRTEGSFTEYVQNPPFDLPNNYLAPTNLNGVAFVPIPPDWRNKDTHRRRFRAEWCNREALSADVCGRVPSPASPVPTYVSAAREAWCSGKYEGEGCATHFAERDRQFEVEWDEERGSLNTLLGGSIDLAARDLRGASMVDAFLPGADLRKARLEGADLRKARLEGADLWRARLKQANLGSARLEGANLKEARLELATLWKARLDGADLREARLERANLGFARLEGANLKEARLDLANLLEVRLDGLDLSKGRLDQAILGRAQLNGANLREAQLEGAKLRRAWLEGVNLNRARLQGADLGGAWLEAVNFGSAKMVGVDLTLAAFKGSNLINSDLRSALWKGAKIGSSPLRFADLRDAKGLTQEQLSSSIGNIASLLPIELAPDTGQPYFLWSCWEYPPENYAEMAQGAWPNKQISAAEVHFCQHRERVKTGTPTPLDKP